MWRPWLCEQPAAGAFPPVIGSLRFDLTVVRKPPACRADERPLMWAPVGRVTAAPVWRGAISGGARHIVVPRWIASTDRPMSTNSPAHAELSALSACIPMRRHACSLAALRPALVPCRLAATRCHASPDTPCRLEAADSCPARGRDRADQFGLTRAEVRDDHGVGVSVA